jgi:hypothetical protein
LPPLLPYLKISGELVRRSLQWRSTAGAQLAVLGDTSLRHFPTRFLFVASSVVLGLGVWTWLRSQRAAEGPSLSDIDVNSEMRLRAEHAVEEAARHYDVTLEYNPASVEKVEEILDKIHEKHGRKPLSEPDLVKESLMWGAYIGEVIKKIRPCRWALNSRAGGNGSLPIVFGNRDETFPVRWCFKRLTNGQEDNVWHKFRAFVVKRGRRVSQDPEHGGIEFRPETR